MHFLPTGLTFGLLSLLAPAPNAPVAASQAPAHETTIARLVPDGATIVFRVSSFDAFLATARGIAETVGEEETEDMNLATMLLGLEVRGDPTLVDRARPMALALTLSAEGGALQTAILPVTDTKAFVAGLGGDASAELDGYVGVSQVPSYAVRAEANPLAVGLPATVISARLDLQTIIELYRPMIDGMLAEFEGAAESPAETGMDVGPIFDWYMDGIGAFLDSADELDLSFAARGSEMDLRWVFRTLAGSPMAGMASGTATDLNALAGFLDPADPIASVGAMEMSTMLAAYENLLGAVVGIYPEPMRKSMEDMVVSFKDMAPFLGNAFAVSGGFTPQGMRMTTVMTSPEPQKLLDAMVQLYRSLSAPGGMFVLEGLASERRGELGVTRMTLRVNPKWYEAIAEEAGQAPEAMQEEMRAMLDGMYGKDGMRLALTTMAGRMAIVAGGDDAYLDAALARLAKPGAPAPEFRGMIARIDGAHPSAFFRLDIPRMLQGMRGFMGPAMGMPTAMPDLEGMSAPIDFCCGARGLEWSGGLEFDLAEFVDFVDAMGD